MSSRIATVATSLFQGARAAANGVASFVLVLAKWAFWAFLAYLAYSVVMDGLSKPTPSAVYFLGGMVCGLVVYHAMFRDQLLRFNTNMDRLWEYLWERDPKTRRG